ncbi:MAG: ABC transporter substrate-binding protein [Paracoccaceae bacterium]|nr:MAG: ABC transporter substrate-binding protein [Paracoccaceae bacterium]
MADKHDGTSSPFADLRPSDRQALLTMLRRGASRRDVLGWMMGAGASAAFAGSIFAGASMAHAQTPKRGGKLTFGEVVHGPDDSLDPLLVSSSTDFHRMRMFYSSLTRLTDNLTASPEIAEEFVPNADATEWTFKLKQGVEFHDGKTLTADDVIYSMNRHLGEGTASRAKSLVADIERWEKVGPYEVKAILKTPNADLPIVLGTFHFKIVQDGATDFSKPIGSGPFRVAEFVPGVRARGTAFENYWGDGPYIDEIENFGIPDPVARMNAFLAGDLDVIQGVLPNAMASVSGTPGKRIIATESGSYVTIAMRRDMAPGSNDDLVMAFKYLMDRERLLKGTLAGQGTLGNDQPINKAYADWSPDLPQRMLDPEKAKFHFQKSGIGSTVIPIIASEVAPASLEQALVLQREAQAIGMNIEVQRVSTDGYWSAVWLVAPVCIASWNMRPTANIQLTLAYKSDANWNESHWKNPMFDDLLIKSRATTDATVRKQMYHDMQEMVHNEAGSVIPVHRNFIDAANDYVKGFTNVPLAPYGGVEGPEYYWIDKA